MYGLWRTGRKESQSVSFLKHLRAGKSQKMHINLTIHYYLCVYYIFIIMLSLFSASNFFKFIRKGTPQRIQLQDGTLWAHNATMAITFRHSCILSRRILNPQPV